MASWNGGGDKPTLPRLRPHQTQTHTLPCPLHLPLHLPLNRTDVRPWTRMWAMRRWPASSRRTTRRCVPRVQQQARHLLIRAVRHTPRNLIVSHICVDGYPSPLLSSISTAPLHYPSPLPLSIPPLPGPSPLLLLSRHPPGLCQRAAAHAGGGGPRHVEPQQGPAGTAQVAVQRDGRPAGGGDGRAASAGRRRRRRGGGGREAGEQGSWRQPTAAVMIDDVVALIDGTRRANMQIGRGKSSDASRGRCISAGQVSLSRAYI